MTHLSADRDLFKSFSIWSHFIPSEQYHVFQRGAYFAQEVIRDRLAVISLNTLYWYDSNKGERMESCRPMLVKKGNLLTYDSFSFCRPSVVDGCRDGSSEPGALEFDWLEFQLDGFRERGMQVWLTGHVPPSTSRYFSSCYLRYGELALRFQDTIVGHLYGHMNVDHFYFVDVDELEASSLNVEREFGLGKNTNETSETSMRTMGRKTDTGLQEVLFKDFGDLPKRSKLKLEDYAVVNVAPSVIPTYFPGIRVFSYNVTGIEHEKIQDDRDDVLSSGHKNKHRPGKNHGHKKKKGGHRHGKKPKSDCRKEKNQDKPHCKFRRKPRYYSPNSPSRSNTMFTPLGYTQFYLAEIDEHQKKGEGRPGWEVEYTTYHVDGLLQGGLEGIDGSAKGRQRVPWHLLPGFHKLGLEDPASLLTKDKHQNHRVDKEKWAAFKKGLEKVCPFKLPDLTIPTYLDWAKRLSDETKLWNKFARYMQVSFSSVPCLTRGGGACMTDPIFSLFFSLLFSPGI